MIDTIDPAVGIPLALVLSLVAVVLSIRDHRRAR